MLALPALATAEEFSVNTAVDMEEGPFSCTVSIPCSLRGAIIRANETTEADLIRFGGVLAGTELEVDVEELGSLPEIEQPLTIDGGSAVGADGDVGISLVPGPAEGSTTGLEIFGTSDVVVEGISFGGFGPAIAIVEGSDEVTLCNNHIGVDIAGDTATPNLTGVYIAPSVEDVDVGDYLCKPNVISGNVEYGLVVEGVRTEVTSNLIGTDASGQGALPNGAGGIEVGALAERTRISNTNDGEGTETINVIAHNGGPGVAIASGQSITSVYGNSIFDNDGLGIEIFADDEVPAPTLTGMTTSAEATTVTGTLSATPSTAYYVDVYASASCDPSGAGEGETYLGGTSLGETDSSGALSFSAEALDELPPGQAVITATVSEPIPESGEQVSEFSRCFTLPGPPAPAPPAPPLVTTLAKAEPQPENGEKVVVETKSGTIYITLPGKKKQVKLTEGQAIPVGSIVDATRGKVTLTSVNKAGEVQTAVFYGGKFLVAQTEGSGLVVLKLRGGNFSACASSARGSGAVASAKPGRRLWGSGKGKFRTEGSYGSATVRGTIWLTEDRCNGTYFKTKKGVVSIRDFVAGTNFSLGAGKSYLAKKEG